MTEAIDRRNFGKLALGVMGAAAYASPVAQSGWTQLWNGKSLDGWTTWLARPAATSEVPGMTRGANGQYTEAIGSGRDPLKVFTVAANVDGAPAIRVSGEAFGELRTVRSFENYHLRFQFKWGEKKWPPRDSPTTRRDSGLLYHVHAAPGAEGRTWARSVELQIQEGDVGDLYAVGSTIAVRARRRAANAGNAANAANRGNTANAPAASPAGNAAPAGTAAPAGNRGNAAPAALYDYDPTGEWTFFTQSQGSPGRCIKQPDNEKPTGQWNMVELVCVGQDCIHIVNGKVVMRLRSPLRIDQAALTPVTSGALILQSEGAEVFYRDVALRSIKAIPAEFAG